MNADRAAVAVVVLAACLAAVAGAQVPATEGQGAWRLTSPLVSSRGLALWLSDGAGSWRLEIGVGEDEAPRPSDLFARHGEGWTLSCAGGSPVLMQPWGEPWRETGPGFAAAVAAVLGRWEGSAAKGEPATVRWRAGPPENAESGEAITAGDLPQDWNPAGAAGTGGGGLRRELTSARPRARRPRAAPAISGCTRDGGLELTSARWPGRLHLSPATANRRPDVPAEAYLPIWSLAEIGLSPREP